MSSVVIAGNTSGSVTLAAPNVAGTTTLTLPATSGTVLAPSGGTLGVAQGGTGLTSPGTSGNVLTSDGTNWTSASPLGGLGVGQTWQNLTSSRAFSTLYTNSTGKPIFVSVSLGTSQSGTITAYVNGLQVASHYFQYEPATPFVDFIVPNGSTYQVNGNKGLGYWAELR